MFGCLILASATRRSFTFVKLVTSDSFLTVKHSKLAF